MDIKGMQRTNGGTYLGYNQQLIKRRKVPREQKRANIVPTYKGGNEMGPLNYRPVSLISIVSKLCEIIIKDR